MQQYTTFLKEETTLVNSCVISLDKEALYELGVTLKGKNLLLERSAILFFKEKPPLKLETKIFYQL